MANLKLDLIQKSEFLWEVPLDTVPGMNVPGVIVASKGMIAHILDDNTPQQVANVATLPGIVRASMAMPDIHWGYGFPIGGVAAFEVDKGIISPGGVGYDINCGVTLVRTDLRADKVKPRIKLLVDALYNAIPCGVGSEGSLRLSNEDYNQIFLKGAKWVVEQGLAETADVENMEEGGAMPGGNPELVSAKARQRAHKQLGTLGSGNHFVEVQEVTDVYDADVAAAFGLAKGQVCLMIHSGSRGLGHQICDDNLSIMQDAARKYGIQLTDRQLACAPFKSSEGRDYFEAMVCAANFAWANRLMMVSLAREAFADFFKATAKSLGMHMVYDVCHNIAKEEEFLIDSAGRIYGIFDANVPAKDARKLRVCVHRKGATRSLGPGDPRVPEAYRAVGQPVLIPGDMGRSSYVLVGTEKAASVSFSSSCHGAGRVLSRNAAIKLASGKNVAKQLAERGITVRSQGKMTLVEEVPEAYKDVTVVVEAVVGAGASRPVARLKPVGTIKG